jgi:hypothetical protein
MKLIEAAKARTKRLAEAPRTAAGERMLDARELASWYGRLEAIVATRTKRACSRCNGRGWYALDMMGTDIIACDHSPHVNPKETR